MESAYKIRDWNKHFECAQSRKSTGELRWVAVPTKHDGKGYRRIMRLPDGPAIYAAWVLIVQVAAKCPERGVLADSDGPLTAEDLSMKTDCPAEIFERALEALCSAGIAWLERKSEKPDTEPEVVSDQDGNGSGVVADYHGSGTGVVDDSHSNGSVLPPQYRTVHNKTNKAKKPLSAHADEPGPAETEFLDSESKFIERWNSAPGVVKSRGDRLTKKRRSHFRQRIRDPDWDWEAAMKKFPLKCFGDGKSAWKPDLDWFLRPDSVLKILEGKYDWTKSKPPSRTSASYDPGQSGVEGHF